MNGLKIFNLVCIALCLLQRSSCNNNNNSNDAQILKFENSKMDSNGYAFFYETSDGISRQETAELKNAGTELEAIAVKGSVKWVGPDGIHYKLNYLADENGFQPQGEHLPRLDTKINGNRVIKT